MAAATVAPAPLWFQAVRNFVCGGREVRPGEVVDVSTLAPQRVIQMEQWGYGYRVAAAGSSPVAGESTSVEVVADTADVGSAAGKIEADATGDASSSALIEIGEVDDDPVIEAEREVGVYRCAEHPKDGPWKTRKGIEDHRTRKH